ncbi:glycosyltransferase [Williamsia muralis]|uniref:glycosyltransferase n=1 Tax=Williamsia marianensis TaxID=85044 RepID=UPI000DE6EE7B|nr:transferase family hexapeptide repeat protein [Williamsia marianensis]
MTTLCFVIPTLGRRPDWLRKSVEAVLESKIEGLKLVVVGPPNADLGFLRDDVRMTVLRREARGLSGAINDGWDTAPNASFFAWIGDDDLLRGESLAAMTDALRSDPNVSAVYGRVRYIDSEDRSLFVTKPGRFAVHYSRIGKDVIPQPGSVFRNFDGRPPYLDEDLQYGMDLDLFLRCIKRGRVKYVPLEVASFRLHAESITSKNVDRTEALNVRGRYLSDAAQRLMRKGDRCIRVVDRVVYRVLQSERTEFAPTRRTRMVGLSCDRDVPSLTSAWVLQDVRVNRGRYRSILLLVSFRLAQAARYPFDSSPRLISYPVTAAYMLLSEWGLSVELPVKTVVGKRLQVSHCFSLVVNQESVLGNDVLLRQGVTIGNKIPGGGCPVIGDGVSVGAGAAIIGDVKVGACAQIGAGAVVLRDVPPASICVGNPGRIIDKSGLR